MSNYVSPVGYVDLDNDCNYSLDLKSTRSRESINPKEDLAFYFETYIVPKYGLNNINVNNVASFMKDLEMNWTKIDPSLKSKVMDIMVDGILSKNSTFKQDLLAKLNTAESVPVQAEQSVSQPSVSQPSVQSTFRNVKGKSGFGSSSTEFNFVQMGLIAVGIGLIFIILSKFNKVGGYARFK
jgi:hypothetical protein